MLIGIYGKQIEKTIKVVKRLVLVSARNKRDKMKRACYQIYITIHHLIRAITVA